MYLLPEWITPIVSAVLYITLDFMKPFERDFRLNDYGISHKMVASERVPVWLIVMLALTVPIGVFIFVSFISNQRRHYFILIHVTILAFAISLTFSGFVTGFLKDLIGRPRPDFLDRCQPKEGTPTDVFVNSSVCTNTDSHILKDGFKSLPSGHSSFSFSAFYFLSLWMAGQLGVFSQGPNFVSNGNSIKGLVCSFPTLFASFVAVSRTEDNRHRGSDIIAGTLIGAIVAWITYRLFFPPLAAADCDTPYVLSSLVAYENSQASNEYQPSNHSHDIEADIGYHGSSATTYDDIPNSNYGLDNEHTSSAATSSPQNPVHQASSKTPLVSSEPTPISAGASGASSMAPKYGPLLAPIDNNLGYQPSGPSSAQAAHGSYEMQLSPVSSNNILTSKR